MPIRKQNGRYPEATFGVNRPFEAMESILQFTWVFTLTIYQAFEPDFQKKHRFPEGIQKEKAVFPEGIPEAYL